MIAIPLTTRARFLTWLDRVLLTLLVVLLIHVVATTRVYSFASDEWGLVSRLPVTYWCGLAILGLFWVRGRNSRRNAILAFSFTVGYLYVAPAIVRVPVWLSNSFYPYREGVLIAADGHLLERPLDILTSYHNWPVFLYLTSVMTILAEVPAVMVLQVFPILTMFVIGVLSFLTFRKLCSDPIALAGAGWVVASFWLRQHYFGPPGLSYVFFLLIFLFGVEFLLDEPGGPRKLTRWFLVLFCFICIVLTHALTSFMAWIVLLVLWLTRKLVQQEPASDLALLSLVSASILSSYYSFVLPSLMKYFGESLVGSLVKLWELSIYREPSRLQASTASVISYNASLAIVVMNFVAAVGMLVYLLRFHRSRGNATDGGVQRGVWVFSFLSLLLLGLFAFAGEYGAHESYQRAFMYGLVPLTLLAVSLLRLKPKVLFLCLAALIFLNVPAQYGSDNFRVATAPQLAGSEFFAAYVPENISCLTKFSLYIRYFNPLKNYRFYSVGELPFTEALNASVVQNAMEQSDYIVLSDLLHNYYFYYLGENPFENPLTQVQLGRTNRVYDNQGFQIYSSNGSQFTP